MRIELETTTGDKSIDEELTSFITRNAARLEEFEDRSRAIPSVLWAALHFASGEPTFAEYFQSFIEGAAEQIMKP